MQAKQGCCNVAVTVSMKADRRKPSAWDIDCVIWVGLELLDRLGLWHEASPMLCWMLNHMVLQPHNPLLQRPDRAHAVHFSH